MNYFKTCVLLAGLTALLGFLGNMLGGAEGTVIMLGIGALINFFTYWNADKMVLRAYNAREVDSRTAPGYYGIVAKLAESANLPMPKVYIVDNPQPNAFATGRNPQNAAVAATTGLLQMLSPRELVGVMAHELAHVKNRDTLIMTVAATVSGAISTLARFSLIFGGSQDSDNTRSNPLVAILTAFLAPIAAMILQMAISRSREYAADRMGAKIARDPRGLASALLKISGSVDRIPNYTAENNPATASLFIINPLSGQKFDNLFTTHPAVENRLAALHQLSQEMQGISPLISTESRSPFAYPHSKDIPQTDHPAPTRRRGPWG